MRFKKRHEEEAGLNVAPLVDMMFLLLIFFMVTSHFDVASGVRIQLPKISKKLYREKTNEITLVIHQSGQIYLKGNKVEVKNLGEALKRMKDENGPFDLVLHADKDVRHGEVVQIMDMAKTAGAQAIIIAARWDAEKIF